MDLKQSAQKLQPQLVAWRRALHQIPELNFELPQTSSYLKEQLDHLKIPHHSCAGSGIVGLIQGDNPGPTIALRADMDALPIREETGLPFASTNGNMHACGHDAHMAMLLGAAKLITGRKHQLQGSVKLIFQPAEEGEGGAAPMIAAGCLENPTVDAVLALHIGEIFPEVGTGQIGIGYGTVLAASSPFSVTITGQHTHCSTPHTGIDPITTAAEIILALQKIISRELDPTSPAVISITQINGGTAPNIIPGSLTFTGDIRAAGPDELQFIKTRLTAISTNIAAANRAEAAVAFMGDFPATINDKPFTRAFATSAAKIVGHGQIIELKKPHMGNEDFSYFLRERPGTLFFLGSHNPAKGITHPHHNPKFDIDEDVLWIGPAVFTQAVVDYCGFGHV